MKGLGATRLILVIRLRALRGLPRREGLGPVLAAIRRAMAERGTLRVRYAKGDGQRAPASG